LIGSSDIEVQSYKATGARRMAFEFQVAVRSHQLSRFLLLFCDTRAVKSILQFWY